MITRWLAVSSILILFPSWNFASFVAPIYGTTCTCSRSSSSISSREKFQLATSDREQPTTDQNFLIEQRNLRFSGVGRLFTTTTTTTSDPNSTTLEHQQQPHLQVIDRLSTATVLVVGLGGVGSWAAEAICRSGVGTIILIDLDDICISNTNRQLHALSSTIGRMKIDEMKNRLMDINPDCNIELLYDFVSPDNIDEILQGLPNITACLDAIDGTKAKVSLIAACARYGIPIVTCGGSAGRTDPTKFVCKDLTKVEGDPLLSACRKDLRKLYGYEEGLSFNDRKNQKPPRKWNIQAVYSTERQKSLPQGTSDVSSLRRCDGALGTACFVTGTSGFVAAGEVISQIASNNLLIPRRFSGNKPRTSINKEIPSLFDS